MNLLFSLFWLFSSAHAFESEELDKFLVDLIDTWQLHSPTVIVQGDLPELCMARQWLLCLSGSWDAIELANHLALAYLHRRQDGIVLVGRTGHKNLLRELVKRSPSLLTTNYPVFMPISYKNDINLQLDSNIIMFNESSAGNWKMLDVFSVKNGPAITLGVGKWDSDNGIVLQMSKNRWERRKDLKGATFMNCFAKNPGWAESVKDKHGNITGSKGRMQEILFYITDNLNLTVKTCEVQWGNKLLENGSWTAGIGTLQRRYADVASTGLGMNLQRSDYIDYPIPVNYMDLTLHAAIPKGSAPNMWVYVRVFGPFQWALFVSLLMLLVIGLHLITVLSHDKSGREFGTKRGANKNYELNSAPSAFALAFMYAIQMGSHTNSKLLAPRLLTLTISWLTFLSFAYYTTDITSEMTSGAPEILIRTFQDVIHHDYKVVTNSPFYANKLKSAKNDTAMNTVYKSHFEKKKTMEDSFEEVVNNPKTVHYARRAPPSSVTPSLKALIAQTFPLNMDDSIYSIGGLALQKDSEYLQLFNHYLLKAYETGFLRRLNRRVYIDHYTRENFEMVEPQPLGPNNVMFVFIMLAFGICVSITSVLMELAMKKLTKQQNWVVIPTSGTGIRENRQVLQAPEGLRKNLDAREIVRERGRERNNS